MQPIQAKGKVKEDRTLTLTVQLPDEVQAGEYDIELVLKDSPLSKSQLLETSIDNQKKSDRAKSWEKWVKEVKQLQSSPRLTTENDYQKHIIEKYQKQGLEL